MLNILWFGMMAASVICAALNGRIETLSSAAVQGADKAIRLIISMAGVMCLWTGFLKIAEQSGATGFISKLLSPVLSRLMPDYAKDSDAMRAVSANITANMLGLGNAATPLGIKAMQEMQRHNRLKTAPNNSMVMFVVINTASVQLIPTTLAAIRQSCGSSSPFSVLPYIWMTSALTLLTGVTLAKIFSLRR